MLRLYIAIITVLSCNVLLGESKLESELSSINKNLVEAVHSSDLIENFNFLNQTLNEKSKKLFWKNGEYVKTLKKLVALKMDQCDMESYKNLKEITDTLGDAHSKTREPIRRISKIVREVSMQHAEHCQKVYVDLFESKNSTLDREQFDFVKTFFASIKSYLGHNNFYFMSDREYNSRVSSSWNRQLKTNWLGASPRDGLRGLFERTLERNSIEWEDHKRYVYMAITMNSKGDTDSKYLKKVQNEVKGTEELIKPKLEELYNKYLINPCKYYVNELRDVFEPATYDAELYHNFDEHKPEFYYSWAHYKLCGQLLAAKSQVLEYLFQVAGRYS